MCPNEVVGQEVIIVQYLRINDELEESNKEDNAEGNEKLLLLILSYVLKYLLFQCI